MLSKQQSIKPNLQIFHISVQFSLKKLVLLYSLNKYHYLKSKTVNELIVSLFGNNLYWICRSSCNTASFFFCSRTRRTRCRKLPGRCTEPSWGSWTPLPLCDVTWAAWSGSVQSTSRRWSWSAPDVNVSYLNQVFF